MNYGEENFEDKGRLRNGNPKFYKLLEEMAETHDKKSHDYASNDNPSGNYHFAGQMAALFNHSPEDAGFFGRIAEKIYRLANLESGGKIPNNESVEDTERDIAVITCLWMADRRDRRAKLNSINMQATASEMGGAIGRDKPNPELIGLVKLKAPHPDIARALLMIEEVNRSIVKYLDQMTSK